MRINFYDDPLGGPRPREDVRFNELGLFVYDDRRRVAVGFDIVPFREPPSISVVVTNSNGVVAASLRVINAIQPNFNLTMHLRDEHPSDSYDIEAIIYYISSDGSRTVVDKITRNFDLSQPGEQ